MKLGFNLLLWTTHVTEVLAPVMRSLKAMGYDGVEVPVFEGDIAHYEGLRRLLDGEGLRATAVGVVPDEDRNPLSEDPARSRAGVDHLRWMVDCSKALGAEVLCGPFFQPLATFSGRGPTEAEWERLVATQGAMAEHARDALILAVEPLNRFECYALNTCAQAAELVRRVGRPNYGYLFDTFHSNIEEKDAVASLRLTLPQVSHLHVSENDRGTPGTGHAPIAQAIRAARDGGYDGWLTVEAFGDALPALAAATRVWRPLFERPEDVQAGALALMRRALAA